MKIRPVHPDDLATICSQRERMFREAGRSETALNAVRDRFREWLRGELAAGRYFGFIAEAHAAPIAGVGLMEIPWPPTPAHPGEDRRGYVLNVFVEPEWRGRGIAKALMAAGEAEFERRGITYAFLHATDAGRPLYQVLGWKATNEMFRMLPDRRTGP